MVRAESTTCCIVGGGPAGLVAGLLLARAGAHVVVLEKHGDFLNFLAGKARAYQGFRLLMNCEVTGLISDAGHMVGVRARTPRGELEIQAALVLGADGRHSTMRRDADLKVIRKSAPMDVLRFQLSRRPGEQLPFFRPGPGRVLICIDRGGVGINLAIQDAVATANILGPSLVHGRTPTTSELRRVQRRRELPTRVIQAIQTRTVRGLYPKDPHDDPSTHMPFAFRLFRAFPALRHLIGRIIGIGLRPEHVRR